MQRRAFLQTASAQIALAAAAGQAWADDASNDDTSEDEDKPEAEVETEAEPPFTFERLRELAKDRASRDYKQPVSELVGSFADLNYDSYRAIRFRRDADPWKEHKNFRMDLLPPGLIFYEPVQINLVDAEGTVTPVPFSAELLDFDESHFPDGADMKTIGDMGWSGFRLRTPINRPGVMDEFLVFQGASYFRAIARNTLYGLSARGLAINTGSPEGEEFPLFTDFWIHQPPEDAESVLIHAMLDSKSVAGAFQFRITPGNQTVIATRISLFPRSDLKGAGIAPLTSMFWFGPGSRKGIDDYRTSVHDSDGLQMTTGAGERLWRALSLPAKLQISDFMDEDPHGFGLAQRARRFSDYQDAEARYDLRPSAWIEPRGQWGKGRLRLIEIPAENEFNDNIVSFWRPADTLKAGARHDFGYELIFAPKTPSPAPLAAVVQTRAGKAINHPDGRSYVVDFELGLFTDELPEVEVEASKGQVRDAHLVPLPEEGLLRLGFLFVPDKADSADLRAMLKGSHGVLSEIWTARWSK